MHYYSRTHGKTHRARWEGAAGSCYSTVLFNILQHASNIAHVISQAATFHAWFIIYLGDGGLGVEDLVLGSIDDAVSLLVWLMLGSTHASVQLDLLTAVLLFHQLAYVNLEGVPCVLSPC